MEGKKIFRTLRSGLDIDPLRIEIRKVSISNLVPHEGTLEWHLRVIKDWIQKEGYQARPIAVSSLDKIGADWTGKFMIHDGHHRTSALRDLGCSYVMCSVFDFTDPRVKVFDYNTASIPVSKEEVVRRAVSADLTPRFDKHFIDSNLDGHLATFQDNPLVEPKILVKLAELS